MTSIGYRHTEEAKERIRAFQKKKVFSVETCMKISEANRGRAMSIETRQKISQSKKGSIAWNKGMKGCYSEETLLKLSKASKGRIPPNKGKKMSEEVIEKMSKARIGKVGILAGNWKGGISRNKHSLSSPYYKSWRDSVFERDDYTCTECKAKGVYLEAHHISPWGSDVSKRYNIDNGITLCKDCHIKLDFHRAKFIGITKKQHAVLSK